MKILLIAPASGKWRQVGRRRLFNGRTFRFSMLSLLRVAAETPAGHHLKIMDEQVDALPRQERWDLVGITCMTALATRAYELAAQFRERGARVVLGGMHPTLCPEEAQKHADAVVAGEAENLWPRVVQDAEAGCLQPLYRPASRPSLAQLKPAPRHLLPAGHYATLQAVEAMQAGHDWITREFYRPWRIARRLAWHSRRPRSWSTWPYVAAVNLAYYGRTVTWGIRGWNPAEESIPLPGPRKLLTASI